MRFLPRPLAFIVILVKACFFHLPAFAQPLTIGIPVRATLGQDSAPFLFALNHSFGLILEAQMGTPVLFRGMNDLQDMEKALQNKAVDAGVFWTEAEHTRLERLFKVVPLVTSDYNLLKNGLVEKVIVVRKDSGIKTLQDLKSRRLIYYQRLGSKKWDEPLGLEDTHLLALKLYLTEAGLGFENFLAKDGVVIHENLNPQPVASAILSVLHHDGDFTVVNDRDFLSTQNQIPQVKDELMILPIKNPVQIPYPPFFCRADLDPLLHAKIQSALAMLHENIWGRFVLSVVPVDRLRIFTANDTAALTNYEARLVRAQVIVP